ncbi:hypothetical protein G5I_07857 [Acromyrmex echinatior]|uniref:Uncharacterized protein n=1 Tax=Acromyrmex echinatior TaxID=103372 RepID=F4WPX9_ACREC|nr:hypothetical protein G5I_07857 [Acromyrmex echinatior]
MRNERGVSRSRTITGDMESIADREAQIAAEIERGERKPAILDASAVFAAGRGDFGESPKEEGEQEPKKVDGGVDDLDGTVAESSRERTGGSHARAPLSDTPITLRDSSQDQLGEAASELCDEELSNRNELVPTEILILMDEMDEEETTQASSSMEAVAGPGSEARYEDRIL